MKIGVVLNEYPINSETFIKTFLEHFSDHHIVLYAKLLRSNDITKNVKIKSYLNTLPHIYVLFDWIFSFICIPFYFKRLLTLRTNNISFKQIIADAPIWTTKRLDVLHFPFGNNSIGRETYASLLGAKMTVSFRGSDLNVYTIFHSKSYNQLWSFVHKVHCNSHELAIKLKQHDIRESIPITIIPPALRRDLKTDLVKKKVQFNVANDTKPFIIVTIGRLHWIKDYPLALRSMFELKKRGFNFKYYILGDGVEREQLMFLIQELGLIQNVCLFGSVDSLEISKQLANGNIYLQTSLAEGFSNSCLEAQAFGLPCVVPEISGMRECVEDKKTGIIVKIRTENAFADAILNIFNNLENFDSSYISRRVQKQFTIEYQKQLWLKFFELI